MFVMMIPNLLQEQRTRFRQFTMRYERAWQHTCCGGSMHVRRRSAAAADAECAVIWRSCR